MTTDEDHCQIKTLQCQQDRLDLDGVKNDRSDAVASSSKCTRRTQKLPGIGKVKDEKINFTKIHNKNRKALGNDDTPHC